MPLVLEPRAVQAPPSRSSRPHRGTAKTERAGATAGDGPSAQGAYSRLRLWLLAAWVFAVGVVYAYHMMGERILTQMRLWFSL